MVWMPTTVTSVPSRFTSATPNGIGVLAPRAPRPFEKYSTLCSRKMTGLSSRMAVFSRPLASAGVEGVTTFRPGDVAEPGLEALAVLGGVAAAGALLGPDDHRHLGLAAEHVAQLGRLVDDRLHRQADEVDVHDLGDRSGAGRGRADGDGGDDLLGDRRVAHARRPELLDQPLVTPKMPPPPQTAMSSPMTKTVGSRRISSRSASLSASA